MTSNLSLAVVKSPMRHPLQTVPTSEAHLAAMATLMRDYVDAFNAHDPNALDTIRHADYTTTKPLGTFVGLETVKQLMANIYAAVPVIHDELESLIVNGDSLALEYSYCGTHEGELLGVAGTGATLRCRGMELNVVRA